MAGKLIKGLTIEIGADTVGLDKALKEVEAAGRKAGSELREIEKSLKNNGDSAVLWKQKQELLTKALEASRDKVKTLEDAQKGLAQRFQDGEIDKGAYDKFQEKLKKARENLEKVRQEQEKAQKQLENGEIGQEAYDEFAEKVKKAEEKVRKLDTANHSMEENVRIGNISEEQYRAFQRELENARTKSGKLQEQLDDTNRSIQNIASNSNDAADDVDELGDNAENAGNQAEKGGDGFTVMNGALANLVADGIKKASEKIKEFIQDVVQTGISFEESMSKVKAISGAAEEEFERLTEKAKEQGATTKFTADEAAAAFQYMAMAGWGAEDMLSGIEGVMNLAAASGEELASVSDIVTDALTALGMTADDVDHFADVLAAASSSANTNVGLMGESFKYAAPVAGTMGASIEDLSLALGIMANSGIKGSQSGNSLKNALVNLVKPTEAQIEAMERLGLVTTETKQIFDDYAIADAQKKVQDKTTELKIAQDSYNETVEKYGENSLQAEKSLYRLQKAEEKLTDANEELAKAQEGTTETVRKGDSAFADEAGNMKSLKEIMDVLRESFKSIDFDGLGIDLAEIDLTDEEAYSDMLEKISQTTDGLTQAEQLRNAGILFGKQNLSGMLAIINASKEDYNNLAEAIYNCDGAADGMASTMSDNLAGDMTLLSSAFDGVKIALSEKLNPVLRDAVKYITDKVPDIQKKLEKLADKAVEKLKKVTNNLPKIVETGKNIIPIIKAIGVSFAALKVIDGISKGVTTVKQFSAALSACNTVASAFGLALNAVPVVAAVAGIVGLTAAIVGLVKAQKDENTELSEVIKQHEAEYDSLMNSRNAIDDLKDSFYDSAADIENETSRTKELWQELDHLADSSGHVKEKDKARAEYILNELNNALGTEYTMTGNQIDNYKQLADEIDNVIAKKQAEALLDDYLALSTDMTKHREETKQDFEKYDEAYQNAAQALADAEENYKKITGYSSGEMTPERYISNPYNQHNNEGLEAAYALQVAIENAEKFNLERYIAKQNYLETIEYFNKLKEAETAYAEQRYSDITDILYSERDLNKSVLRDTKSSLKERQEAYQRSLTQLTSDLKLALKSNSQSEIDSVANTMNETMQLAKIAGVDCSEVYSQEFRDTIQKMLDSGFDVTGLLAWGNDSGLSVGEVFGDDYYKIVQKQLDSGFDAADLIEWGLATGADFGKEFRNKYYNVVQKRINEGFDVTRLLQWGADSGYATSERYISLFKQNAQNGFDSGFDISQMLIWAMNSGWQIGDMFGENFRSAYTQYLYDTNDLIQRTINSPGDVEAYNNGNYQINMYAKGGFLKKGKAIVAEAGPELIEVKPDGVEVTPLSDNAENTPVNNALISLMKKKDSGNDFVRLPEYEENSLSFNIHETYQPEISPSLLRIMNDVQYPEIMERADRNPNPETVQPQIINNYYEYKTEAKIGSSYDVYKLCEDMARATRQTNAGRGL